MAILQQYNNVANDGQARQRADAGDIPFIPAPTDNQFLQFLATPVVLLAEFFGVLFADLVLNHKWIPVMVGFFTTVLIFVGALYTLLFSRNKWLNFGYFLMAQSIVVMLVVGEVLTAGLLSFMLIPLVIVMQIVAFVHFWKLFAGRGSTEKADS